jgi:hypothetical protein
MKFAMHSKPKCMGMYRKINLIFRIPMDPDKDASYRLKLCTVYFYTVLPYMHYRQIWCAKREVNYRMSKLLNPAFAAQIHKCSNVGALQPRAQGIPHNGISNSYNEISGSHNGTGSAENGLPEVLEVLVMRQGHVGPTKLRTTRNDKLKLGMWPRAIYCSNVKPPAIVIVFAVVSFTGGKYCVTHQDVARFPGQI